MEIYYSTHFVRCYKKLPQNIKLLVKERIVLFQQNPFEEILKTHKLQGNYQDFWSISINEKYRIIFKFRDKNTVYMHTVGDHSVYAQ